MRTPDIDPRLSLIERAAHRLDELRRAGVDISEHPSRDQAATTASVTDIEPPSVSRVDRPAPARGIDERPQGTISRRVELDLTRLAAQGYVVPYAARSQLSDEFRILKRPLLAAARADAREDVEHPNLLMITSAVPAEGKTFTAINLAMSLAMERDINVLLVDADVSRPSVFARLGVEPQRGLLDLLADEHVPIAEAIATTNIEGLSLMGPGAAIDHATEMLASDAMVRLLERLATQDPDRVVVFDAPPLLPSTESRALALNMGQIVFVVAAEQTLQSTVRDALSMLKHCPNVLPVLNKTRRLAVTEQYTYEGSTTRAVRS